MISIVRWDGFLTSSFNIATMKDRVEWRVHEAYTQQGGFSDTLLMMMMAKCVRLAGGLTTLAGYVDLSRWRGKEEAYTQLWVKVG